MSDAVWIALIAGFPAMLVAVGTLIVAASGLIVSMRNSKKLNDTKTEVASIKQVAIRKQEEIDQMTTGAFLQGHRQGEAKARQDVSDYGSLPPIDWKK